MYIVHTHNTLDVLQYNVFCNGHIGVSHFVNCREVVHSSEVEI